MLKKKKASTNPPEWLNIKRTKKPVFVRIQRNGNSHTVLVGV